MDESVRGLHPHQVEFILNKVKQAISMPRSDYNPVPDSCCAILRHRQTRHGILMSTKPWQTAGGSRPHARQPCGGNGAHRGARVLEIVDLNKEMRAANLTSEQQRNSFIADRQKPWASTMDDIQKVMNSAYIYLPLIRGYSSQLKDSSYSVGLAAGIVWFRIVTKGEKARAVPVVKNVTYSVGFFPFWTGTTRRRGHGWLPRISRLSRR